LTSLSSDIVAPNNQLVAHFILGVLIKNDHSSKDLYVPLNNPIAKALELKVRKERFCYPELSPNSIFTLHESTRSAMLESHAENLGDTIQEVYLRWIRMVLLYISNIDT